jgi:fatty-acid desaturase
MRDLFRNTRYRIAAMTNSARDNGFLAFLTYGEGYHNYHHIFQAQTA